MRFLLSSAKYICPPLPELSRRITGRLSVFSGLVNECQGDREGRPYYTTKPVLLVTRV